MNNCQIPQGLRDLLPPEVKKRRQLEKKAAELFIKYGYEEVITPTFEIMDVVETGTGGRMREQLFLFMDRDGAILSLRPEMTVSIARLAATHLEDASFPQRLFYMGNVYRHVQPQVAQYREFEQVGIEMLGASGPWADAEVISIAVKLLQTLGLEDFKVSLNNIGIFNSLLEASRLSEPEKVLIRRLVENKDLVELERLLDKLAIPDELKETIAKLPVLHGDLNIIDQLPYLEKQPETEAAVNELIKIYNILREYKVNKHIVVDMGVIRALNYYTGVVFEGYSSKLGYGLLGGGRYDRLMEQFGMPRPATGFALGMERLTMILDEADDLTVRYLVAGKNLNAVVKKAEQLRGEGKTVIMDLEERNPEDLAAKLEKSPSTVLIYVEDEEAGGN